MENKNEIRELAKRKFDKVFQDRPYQKRLMSKVIADWIGDNEYRSKVTSSLIESPPGSGKTIMGFKLAKTLKDNAKDIIGVDPSDVGIGWVAGRRNLLKQAELENNKLIHCDDVFYISQFTHNFQDCGLRKFKYKLLVIDEAHHEACDSTHNIINALDPQYMLGLSATPKRSDNAKLCFQRNYSDAGFYTLIDEGWLSNFDHWMIPDWKPETVVKIYIDEIEKWGKSIVFFQNREECEKALSLFVENDIKADLVTGETDRESQIEKFEFGDTQVLINMFVLTEGFDCPLLKTVFVRDSGELPTIQMAGRVLRPHPDIPLTNIVQSINTRWPFTRTANIAHRVHTLQNGSWRFVGKSDLIDKMACKMIKELANSEVDENLLKLLRKMGKKRKNRR